MDVATIVGIIGGFALIIMAVAGGSGGGAEFLHVPSMMIVVGGMIASTLVTGGSLRAEPRRRTPKARMTIPPAGSIGQ